MRRIHLYQKETMEQNEGERGGPCMHISSDQIQDPPGNDHDTERK